jgi:hypothetical protein
MEFESSALLCRGFFGKLEAGELPNTPKSGCDDALFIAKNWQ